MSVVIKCNYIWHIYDARFNKWKLLLVELCSQQHFIFYPKVWETLFTKLYFSRTFKAYECFKHIKVQTK